MINLYFGDEITRKTFILVKLLSIMACNRLIFS